MPAAESVVSFSFSEIIIEMTVKLSAISPRHQRSTVLDNSWLPLACAKRLHITAEHRCKNKTLKEKF